MKQQWRADFLLACRSAAAQKSGFPLILNLNQPDHQNIKSINPIFMDISVSSFQISI